MHRPRLTFEEYISLERQAGSKFEYYHGEVDAMPGASPAYSLLNTSSKMFAEVVTEPR